MLEGLHVLCINEIMARLISYSVRNQGHYSVLFNRHVRAQSSDLNSACLGVFCVFLGERGRRVCVCARVHVCAHMCISKYLGGFSCQGENEYWNDYQLINDAV